VVPFFLQTNQKETHLVVVVVVVGKHISVACLLCLTMVPGPTNKRKIDGPQSTVELVNSLINGDKKCFSLLAPASKCSECCCLHEAAKHGITIRQMISLLRRIGPDKTKIIRFFKERCSLSGTGKLPFRFATDEMEVHLCRNAACRIVYLSTGMSKKDIVPLIKYPKNLRLQANLSYLLEAVAKNQEKYGSVPSLCYSEEEFARLKTKLDLKAIRHFVNHYKLKELVTNDILVAIHGKKQKCSELIEKIHGNIITLPVEDEADNFLYLRRRGDVGNSWKVVNVRTSLAEVPDSKKGKLFYRPIDLESRCASIHKVIRKIFLAAIKKHLGWEGLVYQAAFAKSGGYGPQKAHLDFPQTTLQKHRDTLYIAFAPLTETGMLLQLWSDRSKPGQLLFIPYGKFLLVPADVVHGGGFMLSETTRDLRLHFYLYRNAYFVTRDDHNDYKEESDYPQAPALFGDSRFRSMFPL
jgi:hypothetical protein